MKASHRFVAPLAVLCAAGLISFWPASARALIFPPPVFVPASSSLTLTLTDDVLAGSPNIFSDPIAGASIPSTIPPFQLNHTLTTGTTPTTSSALGVAGADQQTSNIQMGAGLTSGTGTLQTNVPGHFYTGASDTDIAVSYDWTIGSLGFPQVGHFPGISYSFALGGVVGTGGSAEFKVNMKFFTGTGAVPIQVGSLVLDDLFSTAGNFTKLDSGSVLLNGGSTIPANNAFQMIGTIDFLAKNEESPSNINLQSDSGFGIAQFDSLDLPEPGIAGLAFAAAAAMLLRRNRRNAVTISA